MADLEEFRLDFDLSCGGGERVVNEGIHQIEVRLGIFDDQSAGRGDEVCAGALGERDPLGFEEFAGTRAVTDHRLRAGCDTGGGGGGGERGDEAGRDLVFLGDEDIGRLGERDDDDRIRFDLELEVGGAGDVSDRLAERDIREGEREREGRVLLLLSEFENDIDALAVGVRLVLVGGDGEALELVERLADCGVAEVDRREDEVVELAVDRGGAARVKLRLLDDLRADHLEFFDRQLPCLVDLAHHVAARLAVGDVGVFLARDIDLFHPAAGGDVVFIHVEDLLVAFEREVVAAGGIKPLALLQELLDLLHVGDKGGGHGLAEERGFVLELVAEGDGRLVGRVVAVLQDDGDGGLGVLEAALGNPLTGELDGRSAEPVKRGLADSGGGVAPDRQHVHRALVIRERALEVLGFERLPALFGDGGGIVGGLGRALNLAGDRALNARVLGWSREKRKADQGGQERKEGRTRGRKAHATEGQGRIHEWFWLHGRDSRCHSGLVIRIFCPVTRSCIWASSAEMSISLYL